MANKKIRDANFIAALLGSEEFEIDNLTSNYYKTTTDKISDYSNTIKAYSELTTFNKSLSGSINELNSYWNKIDKDVSYFLTAPATQTLTTSGAGDLAAKIATLVDGDILEIQADASYSQITIPAGIRFAIRVKTGYKVQLNTAQAILLSNNASNVFMSGFILDSNPSGTNSQGSGIAFVHEAQVYDITFHNCTFRNNNHSAVLLSYHQSTGGDNYTTANLLTEFSERVAFVNCHFYSAANEATEGGALTARGVKHLLAKNCKYNGQYLSRQIHCQNCIETIIFVSDIQRAGGAGNGEGIKIDKIGSPTYRNSAYIINVRVKDCIEGIDVDDDADVIAIDCDVHNCSAEGYSVDDSANATFINCIAYNNVDGFRQEAGGVIELKGCNSFNNSNLNYRMDGGYVPDSSNISDAYQTFSPWVDYPVIQKEPTGFTDPDNIIVTYDSTARTITLTGTVNGYYRGKKIDALTTGWISPAHSATNDKYWLVYNDIGFQWVIDGNQKFYDLLIAFVNYGAVDKWGQRECHGLMPWQTHIEAHETIGTYRQSGGTLASYVLNSIVAADRQPSVSPALIKDEDLSTTNPALAASGNYNQFYLTATNTINFNKTATEIVPLLVNQPYWNQFTGGAWQQTLMSNNYYMSIWLVAIPVTSDAASQGYRFIWVQGQNESLTIEAQRGLVSSSVNLGQLSSVSPEFVFLVQVIIRYQAGNWSLSDVRDLTGSRFSQTSSPAGNYLSVVTSDSTLTGLGTVASPLSVAGGTEDLWDRLQVRASPTVNVVLPHTATDGIALNGFMANFPSTPSAVKYFQGLFDEGSGVPSHRSYVYSPDGTFPKFRWYLGINGGSTAFLAMTLSNTSLTAGVDINIASHEYQGAGADLNYITNTSGPLGVQGISVQSLTNSFTMSRGTTSLLVEGGGATAINQDLRTTASPTFATLNITGKLTVGGLIDPTALVLDQQSSAPSTDNGTIYYLTGHLFSFRTNGHELFMAADVEDGLILGSGDTIFNLDADLIVTSECTIDQNLRVSASPSWSSLSLTDASPTNGLAVVLPTPTADIGFGINQYSKFVCSPVQGGSAIYSTEDIVLMLDSNANSNGAALRIRTNATTFTGGTEIFSIREDGYTRLTGNASSNQFILNTTTNSQQSNLVFEKNTVKKWQIVSRNEIDTPNDRFGIFDAAGAEVFSILQGGNVGIGVTNPNSKLHVEGQVNVDGNLVCKTKVISNQNYTAQTETLFSCGTTTGNYSITVPAVASGNKGRIYILYNSAGSDGNYSFNDGSSTLYTASAGQMILMFSNGTTAWVGKVL